MNKLTAIIKEDKGSLIMVAIVAPLGYTILALVNGIWRWYGVVLAIVFSLFVYLFLKVIQNAKR